MVRKVSFSEVRCSTKIAEISDIKGRLNLQAQCIRSLLVPYWLSYGRLKLRPKVQTSVMSSSLSTSKNRHYHRCQMSTTLVLVSAIKLMESMVCSEQCLDGILYSNSTLMALIRGMYILKSSLTNQEP